MTEKRGGRLRLGIVCGLYFVALALPVWVSSGSSDDGREVWQGSLLVFGSGLGGVGMLLMAASHGIDNKRGYWCDWLGKVFAVVGWALGLAYVVAHGGVSIGTASLVTLFACAAPAVVFALLGGKWGKQNE